MKKYLSLFVVVVLLAGCAGNAEQKKEDAENGLLSTELVSNPYSAKGLDTVSYNDLPTMDFRDTVHDFGALSEGEKAVYSFDFTNNGKTPLIISNASGSCGCTVADFPRDPVAPGASGIIKVVFDSQGKTGHQEKSIAITTNSKRGIHMLYIKGDVKGGDN